MHAIENQVNVLTSIVIEQSKTIAEMNTRLNAFITRGPPNTRERDGVSTFTIPSSAPPSTGRVDNCSQPPRPNTRRSWRASNAPSLSHREDPTYTPTVVLTSHSSDHQGFRRGSKKKNRSHKATLHSNEGRGNRDNLKVTKNSFH